MLDELNIGIIGCGHVAQNNHIPVILGTDQINIKWIYDTNISQLNIDINSKALKNKLIEISTTLKYEDKEPNDKKSYFEIVYATIIRPSEEVNEKKELEKIILCDVQTEIYPDLEKTFLNLMHNSGYPEIKIEKKIDFEKLYNERLS